MAGPFHHDIRSDAEGQGVDNEGTAASIGADKFPLGLDLVSSDVALVGSDADLLIDAGELAQQFDVAVHRLVGVVREGLVVLEGGVLVFLQNIPGNLVQFDGNAVRSLDGSDFDVVALDVAAAKVVDIGVPENFVQFFIPGITSAANLEFKCDDLKSSIPNAVTWNSAGFGITPWSRSSGLPLKGFLYEEGMVVCGQIDNLGGSKDYTFTVTDAKGTSETGDDAVYTRTFKNKTLNSKDAVKLPALSSWIETRGDKTPTSTITRPCIWATTRKACIGPRKMS